jgi:hypothetical protein
MKIKRNVNLKITRLQCAAKKAGLKENSKEMGNYYFLQVYGKIR